MFLFRHMKLNYKRSCNILTRGLLSKKEELVQHLKYQNVIDLRLITIGRNGKILITNHIILIFSRYVLTTRIKTAYLCCTFRCYIPKPIRYFKCLNQDMCLVPVMVTLLVHDVQKLDNTVIHVIKLNNVKNLKKKTEHSFSVLSKLDP